MSGIVMPKINVNIAVWDVSREKPSPIYTEKVGNLAVLAGRNLLRDFLYGDTVTGLGRFALGTDGAAPTANDIALGAEVFRDQFTKLTKESGKLTAQYYLSSTSANGYTLQEAGAFANGATDTLGSGTLYARVTFTPIEKTSSIAITFTWEFSWEVA
ncbi:MAG: hypothetical protein H0Z35_12360 [Thermoanaerobacteraceae bacterium]|nr:hypothetical protein [Thermoanaerobacteraceae bacterium]